MRNQKQSKATKLRSLEKKLDAVKSTFAQILRKQKKSLENDTDFDVDKYSKKLTRQYEALQTLQVKLLGMSSGPKIASYNDAERHKLLTIIKKNYFLQKNLGVFLQKNTSPDSLTILPEVNKKIEQEIVFLGKSLKVKELPLDEVKSTPIVLSSEYKVIEQLMDEIEEQEPEQESAKSESGSANDLSQITGLTVQLEKVLNASGIDSLEKLAALTSKEVSKMDKRILFRGKFNKHNWVGQAKDLLR